ncbi:glycoside hydrolase family 88 protein [uncultured Acetatifactor sp.]|jgi:unsaturated rhamnogalacturonyl hydrolase|uniref:beta-galactosidase BglB n=1 Tax=uncultured Acetatifactor sp. TaxID=1671927 RepID=UPI0026069CB2|nr:glycoside hydrolase family 88 protein [uncultured Acetatifactor sp.]
MKKNLIIFTDSGDTIIDESTQVYDDRGIVTKAAFIPGAGEVIRELKEEGYRIALVADGEWESFRNVYRENGLGYCFEEWIVSEVVGEEKPARSMFDTAMEKMGLTEADKPFIVMIGNNLKKDIVGANRYGITSVWLDWSPRYFHTVEEPDWQPDYTVKTPKELKALLEKLEEKCGEKKERILRVNAKIEKMADAFSRILYETDDAFLKNMESHNLAGDDIARYRYWEWTQGVGLFGLWKLFCYEKNEKYLDILKKYYDRQIDMGFPALNVNTAAPYLTMSFLAEYTGEEKYLRPCVDAAEEIMEHFPRTEEGGFQHRTSDSVNEQELWDDTLYMTVLFLANMGRILDDGRMKEEAEYQFLLHDKYLCDKTTGLWYHGWSFKERNNFAGAFWGRGNCWITMAIPEFLAIHACSGPVKRMLVNTLRAQIRSLKKYQAPDGMWHTLVDDGDSYVEASATCGFAYGILKAVKDGLADKSCLEMALRAADPILDYISEDGVVNQVSYGTPMGRISRDFYKEIELRPMPYGQALAILFLMEYRTML